jgi:hypothetical protein
MRIIFFIIIIIIIIILFHFLYNFLKLIIFYFLDKNRLRFKFLDFKYDVYEFLTNPNG